MYNHVRESIVNAIEEYETIIIHRHVKPDPDALGSQGGLQKTLQYTFPNKKIYVVGEEKPGLQFLNRMDTITDDVYEHALVIVCDTGNTERISDQRYTLGAKIIKIDHHPNDEPYGDIMWVDTTYSSTSEMLVDLIRKNNVLKMDNAAAKLFYAGLIGDTGRFLYDNTSPLTMEVASYLLRFDFKPQDIFHEMYKETREGAKLKGYILQHFEVSENGVAYMYITKELADSFGVTMDDAADFVNVLANIVGNHIWLFFIEGEKETRVRIRSKATPIREIAKQFNGNGHPLASGAKVKSTEEAEQLIEALDQLLQK